ncbi:Hydroxyacylglutathione hydrolase cytoplasmic [Diplonema papillatum]|nr:Hydroxyacylglutathione hydrolase cytoplasmic [Diplonema papillatum]
MGPSMPILPVIEYISHEVFDLPKTELIPVTTVLTTSDHWSFMGGNADVAAAFTGVAIYGGEDACVAGATDTCRDGDIITVGTHLHFEVIGAPDGNKRHLLYYLRGVETGRASPTEASAALFSGQLLVEMTALNLVSVIDRCDLTAYVHSGLGQNAELPTDVLDPSDVGNCASCSPPCSTFDPFVTLYADDVEALEHRMAREEVSAEAAAVELRKLRSEWRERTMLPIHSASFASLDMDSVKAAFIALGTPASPSFLNSNGRVFVSYSRLWRVLNKLHLNITFCPEEALRLFWRDSVSDSLGNSPDKAPVRDLLSKIKLPECEVDLEINVGVDPHISKETCPLCTHLR